MNMNAIQAINLIKKVNTKDLQKANTKDLQKVNGKETVNTKEGISQTKNQKSDGSSFKEVLDVKKNDSMPITDNAENIVSNLEESLDDLTLEEIIDCLSNLVQLLVQKMPQDNSEGAKVSLEVGEVEIDLDLNKEVTSIISNMLNEGILTQEVFSLGKEMPLVEGVNAKEVTNIINNLLEVLKDDNIKNTLDETTLKSFEGLLKKIESEGTKAEIPVIKEAIKEIENVLTSKTNSVEKVDIGTLKVTEIKTDNKETSKNTSNNEESSSKEQTSPKSEVKEAVAKEEKVLKSILGEEDNSKVNKFSLFTERAVTTKVETIQEAPVINKATMVEDVIKSVKYMETNSLKELTVKINPKELGEIAIKLVHEDGAMKATIKANNKDTFSLLSQNINDIKKYLGDQNIKISEVNIGLYQEDTTFFKEGEFNNNFFNEERERNSKSKNKGQGTIEDDLEENVTLEDLSNISMLV